MSGNEGQTTADPFLVARFMGFVDQAGGDGCWIWAGIMNSNGYGRFSWKNKHRLAHRFSYGLFYGDIPTGRCVCHTCDNRRCVNPDHLWLGTQSENLKDASQKGRMYRPNTCGARNGNTTLTERDVLAIREMHQAGQRQFRIAQLFSVSPSTVSNIIKRETWKDVA